MRRRARDGFTLIEVVVVVVLVALLMSTVVVNLDGRLPATRNESAARELLGQLDYARIYALSYGRECEVLMDLDEQRYAIRLPVDSEGEPAPDPDDREVLPWHVMKNGVEILGVVDAGTGRVTERGEVVVAFHPAGSGREVWVHMGSRENELAVVTVRLLALTGLASVSHGLQMPEELSDDDF